MILFVSIIFCSRLRKTSSERTVRWASSFFVSQRSLRQRWCIQEVRPENSKTKQKNANKWKKSPPKPQEKYFFLKEYQVSKAFLLFHYSRKCKQFLLKKLSIPWAKLMKIISAFFLWPLSPSILLLHHHPYFWQIWRNFLILAFKLLKIVLLKYFLVSHLTHVKDFPNIIYLLNLYNVGFFPKSWTGRAHIG